MSGKASFFNYSLGHNEILVEVRAFGLTFRDFLVANDNYNSTSSAEGRDCAGVILAVRGGFFGFQPGDRGCVLKFSMAQSTSLQKSSSSFLTLDLSKISRYLSKVSEDPL
jgi:NADPH:quinone reductase-like Zn-dependent oxidoreductase